MTPTLLPAEQISIAVEFCRSMGAMKKAHDERGQLREHHESPFHDWLSEDPKRHAMGLGSVMVPFLHGMHVSAVLLFSMTSPDSCQRTLPNFTGGA